MTTPHQTAIIRRVAEANGLTSVISNYGNELIWQRVRHELQGEVFAFIDEVVLDVLTELNSL